MSHRKSLFLLVMPMIFLCTGSLAQTRDEMTLSDLNEMFWTAGLSKKGNTIEKCDRQSCLQSGDHFYFDLDVQPGDNHGSGWLRTIATTGTSLGRRHEFPVTLEVEYVDKTAGTLKVVRLLFFDHVNSQLPAVMKRMTVVPISGDSAKCSGDLEKWSDEKFIPGERDHECSDLTPLVYWKIEPLTVPQGSMIGAENSDSDETIAGAAFHPEDGQGTGKGTD